MIPITSSAGWGLSYWLCRRTTCPDFSTASGSPVQVDIDWTIDGSMGSSVATDLQIDVPPSLSLVASMATPYGVASIWWTHERLRQQALEGVHVPRTRPPYPAAFRAEAVELARTSGKTIPRTRQGPGGLRPDPSARAGADQQLLQQISTIHRASRGTYGAPRVHAELRDDHGVRAGRKRIARLIQAAGLVGCHRRRRS